MRSPAAAGAMLALTPASTRTVKPTSGYEARASYSGFAVTGFSSTRPCAVGCRASRRPPTACRASGSGRHAVGGRRDALHPTSHGRVEENAVTAKSYEIRRASWRDRAYIEHLDG